MILKNVHSMKLYLAVGIGGMAGASGRYYLSLLLPTDNGFPFGTLIANLVGCFLLSFLLNHNRIKRKLSPELFAALGTGLIGSFTTFSTFTIETVELWNSSGLLASIYVIISVLGGLLFCFIGYKTAYRKKVPA